MINVCKDCKWCEAPTDYIIKLMETEYWCTHPELLYKQVNKITGYRQRESCYWQRKYGEKCGPEGKLWERKRITFDL